MQVRIVNRDIKHKHIKVTSQRCNDKERRGSLDRRQKEKTRSRDYTGCRKRRNRRKEKNCSSSMHVQMKHFKDTQGGKGEMRNQKQTGCLHEGRKERTNHEINESWTNKKNKKNKQKRRGMKVM